MKPTFVFSAQVFCSPYFHLFREQDFMSVSLCKRWLKSDDVDSVCDAIDIEHGPEESDCQECFWVATCMMFREHAGQVWAEHNGMRKVCVA